ncbi:MAG: MFS transporter [Nanoarchaeota archaeon]|nr:MFS transporter [Nanoarchaeota archaeon]
MNSATKTLLYCCYVWFFAEGMLGPLFAVFSQRIGGDVLDISWAWATYLVSIGVLSLIVGKISDGKAGKLGMMLAGFTLNTLFTFGYLLVRTPFQLLLIQTGIGLANALAYPTWDALYGEHAGRKRDGYTWGLSDGGNHIATGIGILIGGFIVSAFSFRALFFTMGVLQALGTVIAFQLLTVLPRKRAQR